MTLIRKDGTCYKGEEIPCPYYPRKSKSKPKKKSKSKPKKKSKSKPKRKSYTRKSSKLKRRKRSTDRK